MLPVVWVALGAIGWAFAQETRTANDIWQTANGAFRDGIYDVAERELRLLLKDYPDFPAPDEASLRLGQTLVRSGQGPAALDWLKAAAARYSQSGFADGFLFWQAEALALLGRWAEADAFYRELIGKFPTSGYRAYAEYGLGYVLFGQRKFDEADAAFVAVEAKRPPPPREVLADTQLMRARIALERKNHAAADPQFESLQQHYPNTRASVQALYWLGCSRRDQGRLEDAAAAFSKSLATGRAATAPAWLVSQTWLALGEVRAQQKRWPEAAAAFREAFARSPTDSVKRSAASQMSDLGKAAAKNPETVKWLSAFVEAHARDPRVAPVLLRLGQLQADNQQHAEALATYQRLLAQFNSTPEAMPALAGSAWSLLALGRTAEAADAFLHVARTAETPALAAQARFKLGDIAFAANDFTKAIENYEKALQAELKGPLVADVLWQLALAYARAGKADRSGATLERFLAESPRHAHADEARLQLGQAYAAQGKHEQAWKVFEQVGLGRSDPQAKPLILQARLAAADARKRAGHWAEAVADYDAILALKPAPEIAAQAAFERAHCLALSGDEEAAKKLFEQIAADYGQSPKAADAVFWLAQQQFNKREWAEAQKQFATVAQRWPNHRLADSAILMAGRAAMNRQAYEEARGILQDLWKNPIYQNSPLRPDARILQGDTLTEENKFAEALLVFESVPIDFPNSIQADEAWGRVGNCHQSLATENPANPKLERYHQAILAYQQVLNSLRASPALKSQARYWIGKCQEKLGKATEALECYLRIVYETNPQGQPAADPVWFCRAGLDAGELLETQRRWPEAAKLYLRLSQSGFACAEAARRGLGKIRAEHPEVSANDR